MKLTISDALVVRVVRRLALSRDPGHTPGLSAERLLREQPEVLAFVMAGTAQLTPEARAIAVFLGEALYEIYRLAGRPPRTLATADFVASLKANREMALRVGHAHDRFVERYLRNTNTLRQPALIRFITGVLLEPDAGCQHAVNRDELGPLFIVLKSVIDVLDDDLMGAKDGAAGVSERSSEPA